MVFLLVQFEAYSLPWYKKATSTLTKPTMPVMLSSTSTKANSICTQNGVTTLHGTIQIRLTKERHMLNYTPRKKLTIC